MIRRLFALLVTVVIVQLPGFALQQPPAATDGFVPASSLPPGEQLPAAPFLIGSYAFFLALMLLYLWTIWRRIERVEKDMRNLAHRQGDGRG